MTRGTAMLGLKAKCGYKITQKLEDTFNNMELSVEAVEGYRAHLWDHSTHCSSQDSSGYQRHRHDLDLRVSSS